MNRLNYINASRLLLAAALACGLISAVPCSADSVVVFNEIQYHPATREAELEWVELYNQMAVDVDISGWYLSDAVFYQFPEGTIVPGGEYVVVAVNPTEVEREGGIAGVFGPLVGRLDNSGENLELRDHNARLMDSVSYSSGAGWPVAADGSGVTLSKLNPNWRSSRTGSWGGSDRAGGTPGAVNFQLEGEGIQGGGATQGLISYWNFDGAGDEAGDSAGSNDGDLGSGASRTAGLVGPGAISFNNTTNALVNIGSGVGNSFSFTSGLTIEALISPGWNGSAGDSETIFRKEDGRRRILLSFQNDDNAVTRDVAIAPSQQPVLSFGINVGGSYTELDMPLDGLAGRPTLPSLRDGAFHHIAATYDTASGRKAIYIDGRRVFSVDFAPGDTIDSGGSATAYIGNMSGRREPFTGTIDEVAIWERALSDDELASHFRLTATGENYFTEPGVKAPGEISIRFNETSSQLAGPDRLELFNEGSSLNLEGYVLSSHGAEPGEYVFPVVELGAGEYLVLEEAGLGFSLHVSNRLFLYTPCRCVVADAVRLQEGLSGRLPGRDAGWGAPSAATFGSANQFNLSDQIVINEIYYNPADEPVADLEPVVGEVIVPIEQAWNYSASGADLGTQWRDPDFDDGAWETGGALLYHENGSLPAAKTTEIPLGATTYYFRSRFELDADPLAVELYFRSVIDDGAVIYLNGEEVLRLRMPAGEIDSGTFAAASVSNADYEGPFLVTGNALRRGENLLAVEVHQRTSGSSDVVFGLEASVLDLAPGKEDVVFGESREKWVELFNRGSEAVELSGWKLSSGIRYTFGAGESIGPGEYLVVAADREHLESIHPGARIVGNFEGKLSGRSDRIVLSDPLGNPADEVRYFDDGPWPIYADGGGSSIELTDPDSDNNNSGSWSDSDEGARAQWQSYSYQETARPNVGPSRWRELCLGLLSAGEVLIDDLSVVEDPGGAARQLIANGSFESGESGWRLLGNHGHSEVVEDPADPGNRVLRLVATGATEHMHNHVEATLAGGASITNGRLYEISFRARWIAGSNQVHTRLYFNRCPKTTLVERPENPGTPGSRNSRFVSNAGPTFSGLRHLPVVPAPGEPVQVSAVIQDPDGVGEVKLRYSVEGGAWRELDMDTVSGGLYQGTVPGQSGSRTVQFYIHAEDGLQAGSFCPSGGADSRALYRTRDGQARLGELHNIRIVMTRDDISRLYQTTNVMSNGLTGATVVYNEDEVFYDAGVRLRGSERGRPTSNRVSFNIRFPADHLFRGVHRSVGIDRSGGWSGLVPTQSQDEILVKHFAQYAGGIPSMYDDLCRVIAPNPQHTSNALLMMAKFGNVYLDSTFENGSDGTNFKLELIYHPTTANAQGYKNPQPDGVIGSDFRNLGDGKEPYRWNFLIKSNRDRDDYTKLIALCKAFSSSSAQLEEATNSIMDVNQWMRTMAVYSLGGVNDAYTYGNNHNLMVHARPGDGKVIALPWDTDFSFTRSATSGLWGDQGLRRIIELPANTRRYYGHLNDIIDKSYNREYMRHWTEHYGSMTGRNFSGILNYIQQRGNYVRSRLPSPVDFRITTNGGRDLSVNALSVNLEGDGGINVQDIVADGQEAPVSARWTSLSRWELTLPVVPGENELTLLGLATDNEVSATDSITITSTASYPVPELLSASPSEALPGELVLVAGRNFYPGLEIFFGGAPSPEVLIEQGGSVGRARVEVAAGLEGEVSLTARNTGTAISSGLPFTVIGDGVRFLRGDFNMDGQVDISDAVALLQHLYLGNPGTCLDAGDVNNNEVLDITDAVRILAFLFQQGQAPEEPFPKAGVDSDGGEGLGCESGAG
jgi:hypothetical protein